jgi:hypothetical protein
MKSNTVLGVLAGMLLLAAPRVEAQILKSDDARYAAGNRYCDLDEFEQYCPMK